MSAPPRLPVILLWHMHQPQYRDALTGRYALSGGCIISGAVVRESLLFSNVRVEERTSIYRSVILPNTERRAAS